MEDSHLFMYSFNMKHAIFRILKFILFFIAFFSLINLIYLLIIVNTDWDFRKRMESLKFELPEFNLLVLGASTTLDGIDTQHLTGRGIKSYNLALGGSTTKTNYYQLKEYIDRYATKPEYIIYGINNGMGAPLDDPSIHPIVEFTMENRDLSLEDMPIMKFKWLGIEFLKKVISVKHRKADVVLGQLKFEKVIPDETEYKENTVDKSDMQSSYWLCKIAKLCENSSIKFIIIEMPGYRETQNMDAGGPISIKLVDGSLVSYYNFNSREFCQSFSYTDWIGNSHLNRFGAEKLSAAIFERIFSENY